MDEINFLNHKGEKKRKKDKRGEAKIEWTVPSKEKIEFSRREVLKTIKDSGGKKVVPKQTEAKETKKDKKSIFSFWRDKLFGKESHKDVLIDYRHVLDINERNKKISEPAAVYKKVSMPTPRPVALESMKKPTPAGELKETKKESWFKKVWDVRRPPKDGVLKKEEERKKIFQPARVDKAAGRNGTVIPKKKEKLSVFNRDKKVGQKILFSAVNKKNEEKREGAATLETNLIKGELVSLFQLKRNVIFLLISIILSSLIVGGIYGGLTYWDKGKTKPIIVSLEKIEDVNKSIEQLEREIRQISDLGDELKLASKLLDSHIYWTNFFKFLEDITLPDVFYQGISFDKSGEYKLSSREKNFREILDQVNVMRLNDFIKEVKVDGGKVSVEKEAGKESEKEKNSEKMTGVDFTLDFSIDPVLFMRGPRIADIEPISGAVGQYITISGINFGPFRRGKSFVKFYNDQSETSIEADTNFPAACKDNWWHNSYIIVKIPSLTPGSWKVAVANEDGEMQYSANFQVIPGSAGPGICLLDPSYGFEEQIIDVYGDNFGPEEGLGAVEYYGGEIGEITHWTNQKITVKAPIKVQSGPLKIKASSGGLSNDLFYKRLY